jgi:ribosome-binding factor A
MGSRRLERLAQMLKQEASNIILFELKDPRIKSVTVTKAEISADLRHGKIFVSVMEGEKETKLVFHGLRHAQGHIQRCLGKRLSLKFTPTIEFVEDDSIKRSVHMSHLIRKALEP